MAWARLDDGFHDHPKVDELSLPAVGMWTLCLTWAHRHRKTAVIPGHITPARVKKIGGKAGDNLAGELVASGLWETEAHLGGWVIHDFDDYLPRARDPEELRAAGLKGAASRWQKDGKLPSDSHDTAMQDDGKPIADPMANDGSRRRAPASPSRPVPSRPKEQQKTSSSEPRKRVTRIPDDWAPDESLVEAMRTEGIPDEIARRELPRFVDYWKGKGRDATKADWPATWRNWLRRANDETPRATNGHPSPASASAKAAGWLELGGFTPQTQHAIGGSK